MLGQTIGTMFLPLVQKLLIFLNALTVALRRFFEYITKLLGIDISKIVKSAGMSGGSPIMELAADTDDVAENMDNATKKAKKLRNELMGFDQINKLSDNTSDTTDKLTNNAPIDLSDQIAKALANYEKQWNDMFNRMDNPINELSDKIVKFFKDMAKTFKPVTDALSKLWNEGLKKLGEFTWGTLKDFYKEFLVPVGKWLIGKGLPRFIEITNKLLKEINWDKLKKALKEFYEALAKFTTDFVFTALLDFYEKFLVPIAKWTMNKGLPKFLEITTKLLKSINWNKLLKSLRDFWSALAKFTTNFVFTGILKFYEKFLAPVAKWTLGEGLPRLLDITTKLLNEVKWDKLLGSLEDFWEVLAKFATDFVFTGIIDFYEKFLAPVAEWTLVEGLPKLNDIFTKLMKDIDWDSILKKLGKLWDLLAKFTTDFVFTALLDFIDNFLRPIAEWTMNEGLPALLDAFNKFLDIDWSLLTGALKDFWKSLSPLVTAFLDGAKSSLCIALNILAKVFKVISEIVAPAILDTLSDWLDKVDPKFIEAVGFAVGTLATGFLAFKAVKTVQAGFDVALAFLGSLKTAAIANPELLALAGAIIAVYEAINEWSKLIDMDASFDELMSAFNDFLFGDSIFFFEDAWQRFTDAFEAFANGEFYEAASNIINGLVEGIYACINFLLEPIYKIGEAIIEWFCDVLGISSPSKKFKEKAGYIIDGIIEGITGGIEAVKKAIGKLVDKIIDKFCDLFGIHSPSTVFKGYGDDLIKGLIKGIEGAIDGIKGAINKIGNAIKSAFKTALSGLDTYVVQPINNAIGRAMDSALSESTQVKIGDRLRMLAGESESDIRGFQITKKKKGVPKYASGGFPDLGQPFIANENGIEMMGKMGNKPVVANNAQIVEGISSGVYDAMVAANAGGQTNSKVEIELVGDMDKWFKAIRTKGKEYQISTGKPVF